jgi:hypothetical protein
MIKISVGELKKLAKKYGLRACRVPGTDGANIRKHKNPKMEDISWEEFEKTLKKKKLAVYKAENSDFLKIMRDR